MIGIKPSRPPTDTVGAWDYDIVGTGGHLDRDFLDAITRRLPLIVWDASEQFVYGNSAAIETYGITAEIEAAWPTCVTPKVTACVTCNA